jgi:curved DNA-binding protein
MEFKDYYQVLGVARDATADDIKRAYRKLARKYHPDVSKEADAEARFKEISEAYEVLHDPEKRARYDSLGSQYHAGDQFRPPPGWEGGFDFQGGFGQAAGGGGFSDFFESIFSDLRGRGGAGFGQRQARGFDQHAVLRISLEEAYHGGTRQITLQTPQGPRTLNVKIPAGITSGQQIRLPGQGGEASGKAGDLYLEVEIAPHARYRLEGHDVYLELPVTPWEAALGATISVPTLGGAVDMKIPAGVQAGKQLRLRGRGLPGNPPGDQYVVIRIVVPRPKTERDRELYRQMAEQMPENPRMELQ